MIKDKHLIIGGNGFLGKVLTKKLLDRNKKVKVIDKNNNVNNKKVEYLSKDITKLSDQDLNFFKDVKYVYHLAAYQYHSKLPRFNQYKTFYKNNVIGTQNIINLCEKAKISKMVYVSTDMVYGIPKNVPLTEEHPKNPIGDYGKTKLKAENIIKNSKINSIILRPRLIIGAGRLGVFKTLFDWIRKNKTVFLIGNGKNRYQMISVYDCADACILAANSKIKNGIYNLGSDNPPQVYELIKTVIKIKNSKSKIYTLPGMLVILALRILEILHIAPLKKEQYLISNKDYLLDTSKTKKDLKWKPKFDDTKMLLEAYEDYS